MTKFEILSNRAAALVDNTFAGSKIIGINPYRIAEFILSIKQYKLRIAVITVLRKEDTNPLFKLEGGGKYVITKEDFKDTERRMKRRQPCKAYWPVYTADDYEEMVGWE